MNREAVDLLAFIDQSAAAGTRATGRNSLVQIVWVYNQGVDPQGLQRFRQALSRGLLGRRVIASKLPFGRDRWVGSTDAPNIVVAAQPRPRDQIHTWVDERASAPIDPWSGPGWHLSVLPLTDGGSAVTLVVSHILADGVGAATAAAEAALGAGRQLPYPTAIARAWRSVPRDAALAARDVPAAVRAAKAASRLAKQRLAPAEGTAAAAHTVGHDRWAVTHLDRAELTERATALGGTESSMLFSVTAAIAAALDWVQPDGTAVLGLSVNRRTDGDLRANAIVDAEITVDPAAGPAGVAAIRGTVKQTLTQLSDEGRFDAVGPLIPLLPRRTLAKLIDAPPDPDYPVTTCAGVGGLPEPVRSPDGTPADRCWFRLAWSSLPGREPGYRPPYLYVGWTGTSTETTLFAATNLATANDLSGVIDGAVAKLMHPSTV